MDRSEIKRVVWIGGGCGSMFCFSGDEPSVLLAQCSPRYQNRNVHIVGNFLFIWTLYDLCSLNIVVCRQQLIISLTRKSVIEGR
jgi:hypothetical protein